MPPLLTVEHANNSPHATWVLRGDLDLGTVGCAEAVLTSELDSSQGDVVVDLQAVEFIGFAGLDLLLRLAHRLAPHRRRVVIARPTRLVRRIAEIAGIELVPLSGDAVAVPPRSSIRVPGCLGRAARAQAVMDHDRVSTIPPG